VRRSTALFALLLTACAGNQSGPASHDTPWTVASYNIRHGRGIDDVVALERTAAALRTLDADLIGLQEVDETVNRSGNIDEAAFLGEELAMHYAFGAFFDYDGGRYGMAILSRFPILETRSIRLPEGEEPRVALMATVVLPGDDTVVVVNVHFDWLDDDADRFHQAEFLINELQQLALPWLVLGDFNDLPTSRTLGLFYPLVEGARKPAGSRFTFPAPDPVKEIDYIFAAKGHRWEIDGLTVRVDSATSDHRPITARVRRSGHP
jgi:endonuclease/exonuclease/phosphatase family metal-dependent hydrolase